MSQSRLDALRATLALENVDALLVTSGPNRRFLSGFTGSAGWLLISADQALLITDGRYTTQAQHQAPAFETVTRATAETPAQAVAARCGSIRTLGFDPDNLTFADYAALGETLDGVTLKPVSKVVEKLREIKTTAELATLKRAIGITDAALAQVRPLLRPEMRERDLAWELHKAMVDLGASGPAFEIIVAAGENGALPHARPGEGPLGIGKPIVIDFGALLDGYHADMTRTLILGHADEQFHKVYGLVHEALQAATNGLRPGMSGREADALARDVIAVGGYPDAFSHSLGHGVGLEIHEGPRLSTVNPDPLPVGAVFSLEPGIYLPGWGGVRLENLALLTSDGVETLTASPLDAPIVALD